MEKTPTAPIFKQVARILRDDGMTATANGASVVVGGDIYTIETDGDRGHFWRSHPVNQWKPCEKSEYFLADLWIAEPDADDFDAVTTLRHMIEE